MRDSESGLMELKVVIYLEKMKKMFQVINDLSNYFLEVEEDTNN